MRAFASVAIAACLVAACGEDRGTPPGTTTSVGGGGGQGGAEVGCSPGNVAEPDGTCEPAGIPTGQCGEGFVSDGHRSCEPILPTTPCPLGTMVIPGDDSCQPIATCGTGQWGDIDLEPDTQHVDASYGGTDADGSSAKPWPTIEAGIAAAAPGATVAVAEGDYPASLVIDKPVTLWGRCPDLVTVGAGAAVATVVSPAAAGATLRGLTVGPASTGLQIDGAEGITLRELRVVQPATVGIILSDGGASAAATLERIAIEEVSGTAIRLVGKSDVTVEQLYTVAAPSAASTIGIHLSTTATGRGSLELRGATLIGHRTAAIHVATGDATVESVAILPGAEGETAEYGIQVIDLDDQLGTLVLQDSMVAGQRRFAIMARGGQVQIERTVFRGARLYCEPAQGADQVPGSLALTRSVVESVVGPYAVQGWACDLTVAASVLRDVEPDPSEGEGGLGLIFGEAFFSADAFDWVYGGSVEITDSLVARTHEVGILLVTGFGTVTHSHIEGTLPRTGGLYGDGLAALAFIGDSSLTVRHSAVENHARAGIASFSAEVVVGDTEVRCNAFAFAGQSPWTASFAFVDEGGNRCGCTQEEACKVLTPGLDAPTPPIDG